MGCPVVLFLQPCEVYVVVIATLQVRKQILKVKSLPRVALSDGAGI